jgi:hypothetical protein
MGYEAVNLSKWSAIYPVGGSRSLLKKLVHGLCKLTTLIAQLGFYMRKHKDEPLIKDVWNSFKGKPPPKNNGWLLFGYDMSFFIEAIFNQRSKTTWLKEWVQPSVSSLSNRSMGTNATGEDIMANAVFMPSSTRSFEAIAPFACLNGIPSISLDGKKGNWIQLADELTQMEKGVFGEESVQYASSLRPLLQRFVATFDVPNDPAIRLFWNGTWI